MSPPLIRKVREHIHPDKINIIDAPPGTSCPVIAAMKNTDFVVLITEPTPFGLYDLELALGAVRILGIPCGVVINRSDLGDQRVRNFADKNSVPVLMEIPFQRKIAETYSRGELLVDTFPEMKLQFMELFQHIEQIIEDGKKI
jgi:MinD superfamily P-loop ATPase